MVRVDVNPAVLRWARERAGRNLASLQGQFPKLADWESGSVRPTLRQLETFAKVTRAPFGYLFLPAPPAMHLQLTDFRTVKSRQPRDASPELMDTVDLMRRRQAWLREELTEAGADPVRFIGDARLSDDPALIGQAMRKALGLTHGWAGRVSAWTDAVRELRNLIEDLGVMAVINGVVGNNTNRKLDVGEFRGFALYDAYAPLIFVNGEDAKSAQMFTLAHEFAHLWLGKSGEGLSGFKELQADGGEVEQFCDRAAAEFLVPAVEIRFAWERGSDIARQSKHLARRFKVSPMVIGRRALDEGLVERNEFTCFYHDCVQGEKGKRHESANGGNFYHNQNSRIGKLFASYVISAAMEGRLGFKDTYDLTGLKGNSFQTYAGKLGWALP